MSKQKKSVLRIKLTEILCYYTKPVKISCPQKSALLKHHNIFLYGVIVPSCIPVNAALTAARFSIGFQPCDVAVLKKKINKNLNSCSEFYFPLPIARVFETVIGAVYRVFYHKPRALFIPFRLHVRPGRGSFGRVQRGRPIGRTSGPGQTLGTCLDTHRHTLWKRIRSRTKVS